MASRDAIENEYASLDRRVRQARMLIRDFMAELDGPKFTGQDLDGERKDWMATADIRTRLRLIEEKLG